MMRELHDEAMTLGNTPRGNALLCTANLLKLAIDKAKGKI